MRDVMPTFVIFVVSCCPTTPSAGASGCPLTRIKVGVVSAFVQRLVVESAVVVVSSELLVFRVDLK